jgi:hypothetical protein
MTDHGAALPAGDRGPVADPWAQMVVLGETLDKVAERLQDVAAKGRRTRHLAVGLTVSLVLDVVLTVAVTLLSLSALDQGATLHTSQLAACSIGNQSKVEQQQLWGYLFQLSGGAKTSAQKQFLTFVDKTFEPVNCAQVYK